MGYLWWRRRAGLAVAAVALLTWLGVALTETRNPPPERTDGDLNDGFLWTKLEDSSQYHLLGGLSDSMRVAPMGQSVATPRALAEAIAAELPPVSTEAYRVRQEAPQAAMTQNLAHRLQAVFSPFGLRLTPARAATEPWRLELHLAGWGRPRALRSIGRRTGQARGVTYRYADSHVRETYLNTPVGLEQVFVVSEAPPLSHAVRETVEVNPSVMGRSSYLTIRPVASRNFP